MQWEVPSRFRHSCKRCTGPCRFADGLTIDHHVINFSSLDSRRYNWDSVPRQLESVRALLQHDFVHIFPGHGRQYHFNSLDDRTQRFHELLTEEGAAGLL